MNEAGLTWAEMVAHGIRACAWCMSYRHLGDLEEIVLSEGRAAHRPPPGESGQPSLEEAVGCQLSAVSESQEPPEPGLMADSGQPIARRVVYRCRNEGECRAARRARFEWDDPRYQGQ